jgi:hypothetical protein
MTYGGLVNSYTKSIFFLDSVCQSAIKVPPEFE